MCWNWHCSNSWLIPSSLCSIFGDFFKFIDELPSEETKSAISPDQRYFLRFHHNFPRFERIFSISSNSAGNRTSFTGNSVIFVDSTDFIDKSSMISPILLQIWTNFPMIQVIYMKHEAIQQQKFWCFIQRLFCREKKKEILDYTPTV